MNKSWPQARRFFFALVALSLFAADAHAGVVEIAWGADGAYEKAFEVAPTAPYEICGRLGAGSRVRWRFESDSPADFNIHHHEGRQVHFAAQQEDSRKAEGLFEAKQDQDYCWMWSRKGGPAAVRVRLERER